jgi:uncharacterized protein with HEPN domain
MSLEQFSQDGLRVDAVLRNLEIIGEATKNVPLEIRQKYPAIEWRKIAGLRDVAIYAYFTIDLRIIWDVVQNKAVPRSKFSNYVVRSAWYVTYLPYGPRTTNTDGLPVPGIPQGYPVDRYFLGVA